MDERRRLQCDAPPGTPIAISNMGFLLRAQGHLVEAEPYLREAMEKRRRVLGEDHPDTIASIGGVGAVLQSQGKLAEAESYMREAVEKRRRVQGDEHPMTLNAIGFLGQLLQSQGKHAEAIALLAPAEAAGRAALTGANASRLGSILTTLGRARAALPFDADRFALAESNLLEAHALFAKSRDENRKSMPRCVQGLVGLYTAWDLAEPGKGYDAKAAEWKARLGGGASMADET